MLLSLILSKCENSLLCNRVYNTQEINMLHTLLEKTPFLPQEGPPLAPRRACSRTKKGMFSNVEGQKKETRGKVGRGDLPRPLRRRGAPSCYEKTNDICSWGYLIYYINKSTLILIVNT